MLGLPKKRKHVRTVSRFCDEANIGQEDELDLAEFILAAQYLGTEAKDDQLMETFMEMEDNNDLTNQTPQEIIRNVLKKVEEKYSVKEHMLKSSDELEDEEDDLNDEIEKTGTLDPFTEDLNWQNDQIGEMLNTSVESSNVSIARNLLENTALTAKQISDLTGLPLSKVEELEEEFEDLSEDEEDERPLKKSEIKKQQEQKKQETKVVSSDNFNRILGVTKNGLQSIDKILSSGKQSVNNQAESVLELLKKFKLALSNEAGDSKGFKKMRTELLSVQFSEKDRKKLTKDINKIENEKMNQQFLNISNSNSNKNKNTTTNTISINIGTTKKTDQNKFPQLWRVVIHPGALAKQEENIKSPVAGKVEIGTVVQVVEIKGRRVRINKPINGWLSITSSQGKVILEKEGTKSKLMANAKAKDRARQTKILILKSVTTLNEKTVERILIKSEWNLRRAIEAFYIAKFKTQEYMKAKEENKKRNTNKNTDTKSTSSPKNEKQTNTKEKKQGWFSSWKTFIKS